MIRLWLVLGLLMPPVTHQLLHSAVTIVPRRLLRARPRAHLAAPLQAGKKRDHVSRSRVPKLLELGPVDDVRGIVSDTIYRSEDNGYTVLRLKLLAQEADDTGMASGEVIVTARTGLENAYKGQQLRVGGEVVQNPKFGRQLQASWTEVDDRPLGAAPASTVLDVLNTGIIKGIGPKLASVLVERFGENTLEVLQGSYEGASVDSRVLLTVSQSTPSETYGLLTISIQ